MSRGAGRNRTDDFLNAIQVDYIVATDIIDES